MPRHGDRPRDNARRQGSPHASTPFAKGVPKLLKTLKNGVKISGPGGVVFWCAGMGILVSLRTPWTCFLSRLWSMASTRIRETRTPSLNWLQVKTRELRFAAGCSRHVSTPISRIRLALMSRLHAQTWKGEPFSRRPW